MSEAVASGVIAGAVSVSMSITVVAPPWLRGGATPCFDEETRDLFFPDNYGLQYRREITAAKALCHDCPMQQLCLDWAVVRPELDGIWAATTPPERRRIRTGKVA